MTFISNSMMLLEKYLSLIEQWLMKNMMLELWLVLIDILNCCYMTIDNFN
jgi:hypothetical protein